MNKFKTILGTVVLAGSLGFLAAPTAAANTDPLTYCRITDNDYVQQLAEDLTLDEGDLVTYINDYRASYGLPALTVDGDLTRAAVIATQDSVLRGYTPSDHVDSLGRGPQERFDNCGVTGYTTWAEIAYSQTGGEVSASAYDAFVAWMNSPGHNAAMLNPNMTKMGIALGYNGEIGQVQEWNRAHWTVDFSN